MVTHLLSEDVKAIGLEVGFDLVGITTADPLPEAERAILERLRSGMLEGMPWITENRARRSCNPSALLSGSRSVIVLGKYYLRPEDPSSGPEPQGKIARYARGLDYHDTFRPMMARMVDLIAPRMGWRPSVRFFVDSSPLAEKAMAARAGVGWFGRNSCLLTPHHGSWVLMAEILTDLELEPDRPLERDCGRCRICLDNCPTGAIVTPHVVDARRCISYLTIEHRDAIPLELRPLMGDWIFGCDVCQEVCPHNRLLQPVADPALAAGSWLSSNPSLLALLKLDAGAFRRLFEGSPLLRAKRRGLLRNVAVALGNGRDPAAVPALSRALADEEWLVRAHSAWALGRIGGSVARSSLERALPAEEDPRVIDEIRLALQASGA